MVPRFVRRYADLRRLAVEGVARFAADVREGRFPSSEETYHMTDELAEALHLYATPDAAMAAASEGPAEPTVGVAPPG
jgi:3-methyl-2-oxobutanoate hydroxymethyltransferase